MPQKKRTPQSRVATTTHVTSTTLDPLEERVLRATHGFAAADTTTLGQKGDGFPPHVQAKLRELEQKAFKAAGRAEELKVELEREEAELVRQDTARTKIISALRLADIKDPS